MSMRRKFVRTALGHRRRPSTCGWSRSTSAGAHRELELKELDEFLLARALEHDSPTLLLRLAFEYLISARVIRPGPVAVTRRVAHARAQAQRVR